jgi:hypothetical protein
MFKLISVCAVLFLGCKPCPPTPTPPAPTPVLPAEDAPALQSTQVTLSMEQVSLTGSAAGSAMGSTAMSTTVYFSFGADSKIKAADWASWCTVTAPLNCNFTMTGKQVLPNPTGAYLNVTLAFGGSVACGATKAEINVNNPAWFDTLDVSLVDGYSNKIEIDYLPPGGKIPVKLGPPMGKDGNEKVLGLFPYGCDICTARQSPPCGIAPGGAGCKAGTQYKPDVACQYQGTIKGGGGTVDVILLSSR